MHKRIIWTLFFAAFILDIFRSRQVKGEEQSSPTKGEQKEEVKVQKDAKGEKMKVKMNEEDSIEEKELEKKVNKKRKNNNQKLDVRIEFCQSWSHRGYFNQVKQQLEDNFSNVSVIPSDYPLSPIRRILYFSVLFIQFGLIGIGVCINYIKPYLSIILPEKYINLIEENKVAICIGVFFVGNILVNSITNTGAFEIYLNEKLVWSAVDNEKRVPSIDSIINLIKRNGGKLYRY